jgi:alpha-L-rhamnosidase
LTGERGTKVTITVGLGDWVYYNTQTPSNFTSTCYYYLIILLMHRFSKIRGNEETTYKNKTEKLKELINEKYLNRQIVLYANGSQTAQAVALVPDEFVEKVAANLNRAVVENHYSLDFRLPGSKYLPRMLSNYGYVETACQMATKEMAPSWGYWIKQGFTTAIIYTETVVEVKGGAHRFLFEPKKLDRQILEPEP